MNVGFVQGSSEVITLAQNSTKFSSIMRFDKCNGFAGLLLTVSAGSVNVTQQCGLAKEGLFYDPVDQNNTALGTVVSAMSGTRWVFYDPALAPFMRFKVVETNVASATITFTPFFQEDR